MPKVHLVSSYVLIMPYFLCAPLYGAYLAVIGWLCSINVAIIFLHKIPFTFYSVPHGGIFLTRLWYTWKPGHLAICISRPLQISLSRPISSSTSTHCQTIRKFRTVETSLHLLLLRLLRSLSSSGTMSIPRPLWPRP